MKPELKKILNEERNLYIPHIKSLKNRIMAIFTHCEEYEIYKFICNLRKSEYYLYKNKLLHVFYLRRTNILGLKLGYFIPPGCLGKNVMLFHMGNIIINIQSKIGNGCKLHGDNCIGNNGLDNKCPVLSDNVELGIGAKVIGDVFLAEGIIVGANSVVTKSFYEPNITIAGVPARKIEKKMK